MALPRRVRCSPAYAGSPHSPCRRARAPRGHRPPGVACVALIHQLILRRKRMSLRASRHRPFTLRLYALVTACMLVGAGLLYGFSESRPCQAHVVVLRTTRSSRSLRWHLRIASAESPLNMLVTVWFVAPPHNTPRAYGSRFFPRAHLSLLPLRLYAASSPCLHGLTWWLRRLRAAPSVWAG